MESVQGLYNLYLGHLSNPVISLLLGFLFLTVIYWNGMRRYSILKKLNIPGPKPLPYIGNILEIRKHGGILSFHMNCLKKYGRIFAIWTPNLAIVVADPEMLKQIMVKEFENFTNRFIHLKQPISKKLLFSARDETWRRIRHTLTPTFTALKMKLMVPLMEKASDTLVRKLEGVADTGKSVDMREWFSQMTLDVILMTAFGTDSDVQTNSNSDFLKSSRNLLDTHRPLQLIINLIPFGKDFLSLMLAKLYNYWYPQNPGRVMYTLGQTVIRARQEELKKSVTGRADLLQLMLTAHESDGVKKLSNEEISASAVTFLIAGHETTSVALTSVVYHLAMNPDIQEKLRGEIESVVQENKVSFYDLVNNIEYLDCFVNEAQRLNLPRESSLINRECAKACEINGVHFPAGVEVVLSPWLLHHDSNAWPDVNKFDPERHRGPPKESRHPNQFMPFGAGPRHCIGMRFALLEVKLTLVKLMRKFRFVRAHNTPKKPSRHSDMHLLIESLK